MPGTIYDKNTYKYNDYTVECAKILGDDTKIRQLEGLGTLSLYKAMFVLANEINKWVTDNYYRLENLYINYPIDTAPSSTLEVKIVEPDTTTLQIKITNLNTYKVFDNTAIINLNNYPVIKGSIIKLRVGANASAIRITGKPLAIIETELSENDSTW